jgi:signal transduction histidine kinase
MFVNLLSNALKFSKQEVAPEIKIRAELMEGPKIPGFLQDGHNKFNHLTISDNGIGFEPEHGDLIFEAFQRLHPKNAFSGSGVGLAIVRKVVENHNGVIVAEGKPGEGATFHIYLPTL